MCGHQMSKIFAISKIELLVTTCQFLTFSYFSSFLFSQFSNLPHPTYRASPHFEYNGVILVSCFASQHNTSLRLLLDCIHLTTFSFFSLVGMVVSLFGVSLRCRRV
jgi:hypothetical protein